MGALTCPNCGTDNVVYRVVNADHYRIKGVNTAGEFIVDPFISTETSVGDTIHCTWCETDIHPSEYGADSALLVTYTEDK